MPTLRGLIQEIAPLPGVTAEENLGGFFQGAFINNFSNTHYAPLASAKVYLGLRPGPFSTGYYPSLSLETESRADGKFEVEVPDYLAGMDGATGYLVAYKLAGSYRRLNSAPIRLFEPIYRSETFLLADIDEGQRIQIFGAPLKSPDEQGVRSTALNSQIAGMLAALAEENEDLKHIEQITAGVTSSGVHFTVDAALDTRGAFDLQLSPNTAAFAPVLLEDKLLRAKILNIQVQKGNFAGRLCRSRVKLEEAIAAQSGAFTQAFSAAAVAQVRAALEAQGAEGTLAALILDACFSLAASAVRFPLVPRQGAAGTERALVLDVSFGYPRNPVNPLVGCRIPELSIKASL